jgi:putative membrane protein
MPELMVIRDDRTSSVSTGATQHPRGLLALARTEVRQTMRFVHISLIVAFVAVILIFALQNHESVTMSFLGFRISAPLAVVAVVLYLLGMATGGSDLPP